MRSILLLTVLAGCSRSGFEAGLPPSAPSYDNPPRFARGSCRFNLSFAESLQPSSADDPLFDSFRWVLDRAPLRDCSDGEVARPGEPIPIPMRSCQLRALSCARDGRHSGVATASYVFDAEPPSPPAFAIGSTRFNGAFIETLTQSVPALDFAGFRITFGDATLLSCASGVEAREGEPIAIADGVSQTLTAIACDDLGNGSAAASAVYTFDDVPPGPPTLSLGDSVFTRSFQVAVLPPPDPDVAELRFVLDGPAPAACDHGTVVPPTGVGILAGSDHTVHAVACDTAGNISTPVSATYVYNYVPVVLESVTVREGDGTYGFGDQITIDVNFSDFVVLTAGTTTPTLTLELAPAARAVDYQGGSGTNTLTFVYVVRPGDSDSDLDYLNANALALFDGVLDDPIGNSVAVTLPEPGADGSISYDRAIAIDASMIATSSTCEAMAGESSYAAVGTGAIGAPFVLCTPAQLRDLATSGQDDWDAHFRLGGDIDLLGEPALSPIGNASTPFSGVFDGNEHWIAHLNVAGTNDVGLFGVVGSAGVVRNLGLADAAIAGTNRVGAVAGSSDGDLRRCLVTGAVIASGEYAGGLVGNARGTIYACCSTATVSAIRYAGGVAGASSGTMRASFSDGTVGATSYAGGLAGIWSGQVLDSYSTAAVDADNIGAGGLFGWADGGTVSGSYAAGDVTAPNETGAVVGHEESTVGFSACLYDNTVAGAAGISGVGTSPVDPIGLTPVPTASLRDPGYLISAGWDVDTRWKVDTVHGDYPQLGWERASAFCRHYPTVNQFFAIGTGTDADPYVLCRAPQLRDIANDACKGKVNPSYHERKDCAARFLVMDHIDLSGENWSGIGQSNGGNNYLGNFFGNHYTIRNMRIRSGEKQGLFRSLSGHVYDLGLVDVDMVVSGGSCGPLIGYNPNGRRSRVENCWATGRLEATSGANYGGLAGSYENGDMVNSWSSVAVTAPSQAGGLVGGVFDRGGNAVVSHCYATGPVEADSYSGGLIGYVTASGLVEGSYATGSVSGTSYAGGLIGFLDGTLENSYSTGLVSGSLVGGLVGYVQSTAVLANNVWNVETSQQVNAAYGITGSSPGEIDGQSSTEMQGAAVLGALATGDPAWMAPAAIEAGAVGPPVLSWQISLPHTPYCWASSRMSLGSYVALGAGTSGDPFRICSPDQWADYARNGAADWGAAVRFENALNLGIHPVVVGTSAQPFCGDLDGGGFDVSFYLDDAGQDDAGLIGYASGASIHDVRLRRAVINAGARVGGVLGVATGATVVVRSSVSGTIAGTDAVGGLVGMLESGSMVADCAVRASVSGDTNVGGLIGSAAAGSLARSSYAAGTVAATGSAGGLIGASSANIEDSFAATAVTSGDSLVGTNSGTLVSNTWFDGNRDCLGCANGFGQLESDSCRFYDDGHGVYAPWDFGAVWRAPGCTWPELR